MSIRFGTFTFDPARQELWRGSEIVDAEPMALALITHLLTNRDRLVTKDELFEELWDGRAVSDAALSTCIKSARKAVEDSGTRQDVIRTVHGKGLRWVAAVEVAKPAPATPIRPQTDLDDRDSAWVEASSRPSIAILPFESLGSSEIAPALGEAIPHELIAAVSRLRWISVIARGSSFRFRPGATDLGDVRQRLGVRYCLTGSVECLGPQVSVGVELVDTTDGQVIWADRFSAPLDEIHRIREEIVGQVILAVEIQIPLSEASKARLQSPENIDAWATYHLGLQSLYKFDESENDRAISMFEKAIGLEPGFARAHAALSFAHFKTAFMQYSDDRAQAVRAARGAAERAIELDPMDPFSNFNMGRSLWLVSDLNGANGWLSRATSLSPSFAQGIYARSFTEMLSGSSETGRELADEARRLSPLDPLLYAMLGTRALSLALEDRFDEAADWGTRAANAPGAHDLIRIIAVLTNALAGNDTEAHGWAERTRALRADVSQDHFFSAFPFADPAARAQFSEALRRHGFS